MEINKNEIKKQIKILDEICPLEKGHHASKRLVRQKFFENIQTELQAYLLGFYVADGSFNEKRNTLTIKVTEADREIPELYKYISPDARFVIDKPFTMIGTSGKEIHVKSAARIDISNKCLGKSIVNFGYGQRKTYNELHLPNISDHLLPHFIRGYFDGDGSFMLYVRDPNIKNREKNPLLKVRVEWISKTKTILEEIQQFLQNYGIVSYLHEQRDVCRLTVHKKEYIKKIHKIFYNSCHFCLERKKIKFDYYVNTEESQIITDLRNA